MIRRIGIFLTMLFSFVLVSYGQQFPYLKEVIVQCNVVQNLSDKMFYYAYNVSNSTESVGNIIMFDIDISRGNNDVSFDTVGLKFRNDGFTEKIFRNDYPVVQGRIVPVGFPNSPKIWHGNISNYLTAGFGGDSRRLITPGDSLGGFVMMSEGLPGLRRLTVSPRFDPTQFLPDPDEYPDSLVNVDSLQKTLNYYGWTIGPTAPPLDFSATSWIDTLISYKHQSVTLGWLTDNKSCKSDCDNIMNGRDWYTQGGFRQYDKWYPDNSWNFDRDWNNGTVEVLDARLNKAKAELSRKDSVDARRDLEIFVMEVELLNDVNAKFVNSKRTPIMTNEAYALLKYNAEYLINKLPEGRVRK